MSEPLLVVRKKDVEPRLRGRRFVGLPEDEASRWHAAFDVLSSDSSQASEEPSIQQLVTFTVLHHNQSWLTCLRPGLEPGRGEERILGIQGALVGSNANLFLDESWSEAARAHVNAALLIPDGFDLRLAGLVNGACCETGRSSLGLVYVARLRQKRFTTLEPFAAGFQLFGALDLQESRHEFEEWSRIVIDNLQAL